MSHHLDLFEPLRLGPYDLPNRMVMAPMTRSRAPHQIANGLMAEHYAQRADAGLIITEGAQVSHQGVGYPWTPGIHNEAQAAGWKLVTDAVHARGGHIFCQLFHVGRISVPGFQPDGGLPVAPSPVTPEGESFTPEGMVPYVAPRALETDEIGGVVAQYRHAAEMAKLAEFDGVELHSANGYLPHQFLADGTNLRTDGYGGIVHNRCRFVLEVMDALCDVWGGHRVGIHLSPGNPFNDIHHSDVEETFTHLTGELDGLNLAYLSVVEINLDAPGSHAVANHNGGPNAITRKMRQRWSSVWITNGGYGRDSGNAALASGYADMVMYGVHYLANPDLIARFRAGAELNAPDTATFYGGGTEGYNDYPTME